MYKFTQRSWVGGRLDAELMGRQDLQKYFQGASELKNFLVRRQGYISKRRGTELVCDFKNLLGNISEDKVGTYNTIGQIKIMPLVHDKDKGYYIIATSNRAFLASKSGILLMNGGYSKHIDDSFTYTDVQGNEKTKVYTLEDYEIKEDTSQGNNKDPYKGDKAYSIGSQGYDTLQSAINHANTGDRIMVRSNYAEDGGVTITTPTKVTLDLNGHNITFSTNNEFLIINHKDAELKIVNSVSTDKSLSHYAVTNKTCVNVQLGHLILGNGGYIYGTGESSSSNGVGLGAGGRLTIDGGKVNVHYNAITCTQGCVVRINRGEIISRNQCFVSGPCDNCEINGGYIKCVYGTYNNKPTINGGYWECSNRPFWQDTTINGGRFNLSVADYTYTPNTTITKRGEFYCAVANSELDASLALGKAYMNDTNRVVDGVTYTGYKQRLEPDYHYDLPIDNYIPDEPPFDAGEEEAPIVRDIPIEQDKRPFYITFPITDGDLSQIDTTQSGDTIFFAHRSYAPFKIVYDGVKIKAQKINFSEDHWQRPRILSVRAIDNSEFGNGATKTVYYVCTYVKDGIESKPSAPYGYSYGLPWGNTAALSIVCDKGNNISEPDYYNIYKKDGVSYGLVATLGSDKVIKVNAEIMGETDATIIAKADIDYGEFGGHIIKEDENYYINNRFKGPILIKPADHGAPLHWVFVGGVTRGKFIEFNFGERAGIVVDKISIGLDAFTFFDRLTYGGINYYFSGEHFKITLTTIDNNGVSKTFIKYINSAKPNSDTQINCGLNEISNQHSGYNYEKEVPKYYRTIEVSFKDELKEAYPNLVETKISNKSLYQVKSIKVEAFDNENDYNRVDLYLNYVQFSTSEYSNKEWEDDYVTPNLSLTPPNGDNIFDKAGNYPSCVGLHQQRLVFAASESEPFTFWMSCVGDLYNFSTHDSIREDDAITATLAATEFPEINHIVPSRDLMLFADSGEWQISPVSGNALTYKTIQSKLQSAIGCAKTLKPINVGDEIIFVKRSGDTLMATRYNFASDGYESQDLSVLSQWIFKNNPIMQMAYRQHPDSTIECVLQDGTIATLVYMKEHEVCAWSRHELGGGWKAKGVATNKSISNGSTEVMFLVERNGTHQLWKVRDDIPIRGEAKAIEHICLDALREIGDSEQKEEGMTEIKIGDKTYAGYIYEAELDTVRPEPQGVETIQFDIKNAKTAEVRVLDSGDFSVKPIAADDVYSQAVATGAGAIGENITLKTRDYTVQLSGANSEDGRITISSKTPYPLNILSVSINYEIQPLSGSEG